MHLSTLLCPAHRRVVLEEIKNRLERGRPCRLVSTQVIEAGVHVDFPRALRAMAGMDRIIQTAGRCNREGELRDGDGNLVAGRVIVFTPETEILPSGSYVTATWLTRNKLWAGADPHDPEAVREYFQELYVGVCTDAKGIQRLRAKMNFPKVAAKARLIDEDTVPVIVPYDRAAYDRLLAQLSDGPPMRDWWRAAQEHSVSLFPADLAAGLASGQVEEIVPDQVYAWRGEYHLTRGVAGVLRGVEDAEDKDDAKL